MSLQGVSLRKSRMVKVIRSAMSHTDFLHDTARTQILTGGERDDLPIAKSFGHVLQDCSSGLRSIAVSPMRRRDAPADFHAWRKMGVELGYATTYIANEFSRCFYSNLNK